MRRLAGILVALFAAWLGLAAPVHAAPVPTASVQNYTYDSHHHRALVVDAASERGSPATANLAITTSTVDRWSRGTLAGSSESKSLAATTYDATQRLAHVVGSTGTTAESVQTIEGDPSSLQRSRVAANTARGAADEAAAAGRTNGAAAQFDAGGQRFVDVSGSDTPLHPAVQDALDSVPFPRKPWHGGCAEPRCVSQALEAGVDPSTGTMTAVQIGSRGPVPHGEVRGPCPSCQILRDVFGYDQ